MIPVLDPSQYEAIEEPIDDEELQRRRKETTWYSTKEVLAHLENL